MNSRSRTKLLSTLILVVLTLATLISGCEHMEPTQPPPPAGTGLFTFIQEDIFDVSCALSGCHVGISAPHGLDLSEGLSYNLLINVPGNVASFDRVVPFDPDNSLLVRLIEGTTSPRMPFFADSLSQALQDSVRKWVADGAENN